MTQFRISCGTTVLELSGRLRLGNVELPTPEAKGGDTEDTMSSGGEHPTAIWRNANQVFTCIHTGTYDEFLTFYHTLESLFSKASDRQGNYALPRVFIETQIAPADPWWRSEILFGRVDMNPNLLHWPFGSSLKKYEFSIGIRRRYYWERSDLIQIPLKTTGVAKTLNAVTLQSITDATRVNFVDIEAADTDGTLKAPLHVYMYNNSGANKMYYNLWVSHNVNSNPTTFNHMIEGEACEAGYLNQLPASPDLVNYSGGYYNSRTVYTTQGTTFQWELSSDFLTKAAGQYFRVLAVLANAPGATVVYSMLQTKMILTQLWLGPRVYWSNFDTQDLGVIQLPPYLQEAGTVYPVKLAIMMKASANWVCDLDCLILQPVDSWARLKQLGYLIEDGDAIVYDGDLDRTYGVDGPTQQRYNIWTRFGSPIMLDPLKDQRLYFTHTAGASASLVPNDPMGIKVFYRPRRLSL